MVRESTLCEYISRVVPSTGYLIDQSGENLVPYSEDFSSWTQSGTCAVTSDDAYGPPPDIRKTADKLDNTGDSSGYRRSYTPALGVLQGRTFTASVYLRADIPHLCTIILIEDGIAQLEVKDVSVTNTWKRFSVNGTCTSLVGVQTVSLVVVPGRTGVASGVCHAYGALIVENTDNVIPNVGIYHPTDADIIYRMDLQPSNAPTHIPSIIQSYQGSRLQSANLNGVNQYFSMAHDASMNIFDGEHTITILFRLDSDTNSVLFAHGSRTVDGVVVRYDAPNNRINAYYSKAAAEIGPGTGVNSIRTNSWYVLQMTRNISSHLDIYANGHPGGGGSNIATYGIDGARAWVVGADSAGANPFPGEIAYLRVDKEYLTIQELVEEREHLLGIATGTSNKNKPQRYWFYDTPIPADEPSGHHTLSDASITQLSVNTPTTPFGINVPRVGGKGGGVIVEYPGINMYRYSWDFTQWIKYLCTVNLDATITSPARDGLTHVIVEDNANGQHGVKLDNNLVVGQDYVLSVYVKPANRSWIYLYLNDDAPGDHSCYFDIVNGIVGTAVRSVGHIEALDNGWYRCVMTFTASATALRSCRIYTATGDGGVVYLGLSQDSIYIYGAQFEISGSSGTELYATEYHSCDGTPIARQPNTMVLPLRPMGEINPPGNPLMEIYFEKDVGATYTTETGAYIMTVSGTPTRLPDDTYPTGWNNNIGDGVRRGYMWDFDGTNDYLTRADDGTFDPAGSFSVQAIVQTDSISGDGVIMCKDNTTTERGWQLTRTAGDDIFFRIFNAAGVGTSVQKGNITTSEYVVITATYEYVGAGTSKLRLYVNALDTASSDIAVGPTKNVGVGLSIGAVSTGAYKHNGKIHYLNYEDGTVLTEAQHDEFYETFIGDDTTETPHSIYSQPRRLIDPPVIGNSEYWKKLTMEFECNLEYSGSAEAGGSKSMVEISSALTGSTANRFAVYYSAGKVGAALWDSVAGLRYIYTALDPVDFTDWHKVKFHIDTGDMSNMDLWIDDSNIGNVYTNRTGTCDFDTTECSIRIGDNFQDTLTLNGRVRNLKVWLE